MADGTGDGLEAELHFVGHERQHGGPAALVGHMAGVDRCAGAENFTGQMCRRTAARRREIGLARVGLGIGHQLLHGRHLQLRRHDQQQGVLGDQRDRLEALDRIEPQLGIQVRVDRLAAHRAEKQRVAVRRRGGDGLRRDVACRAGPVVDDDRLPQQLGHALRQHACQLVGRSAGREPHHQPHGLGRIGLGRRGQRGPRQQRDRQEREGAPTNEIEHACLLVFM
ncbi:hypothetical protein D9M72_391520 [compost metagenome]